MMGLGIKEDEHIEDGNHLRWFFNPELGFPKYGFTLYRRHSDPINKECRDEFEKTSDFSKIPNNIYPSPYSWDNLTLETDTDITIVDQGIIMREQGLRNKYLRICFPETVYNIVLDLWSSEKTDFEITYYFKSKPFFKRTIKLKQGRQDIEIAADAIDCIQLVLPPLVMVSRRRRPREKYAILKKITWITVSDCDSGWDPHYETHFCLPVPDYPCVDIYGYPTDWNATYGRLCVKNKDKYKEGIFTKGMVPYLKEIVMKSNLPQHERTLIYAEEPIMETSLNPLQVVLLSALDPGTAQILGLYHVDYAVGDHGEGLVLDYKIVGNWTKSGYENDEERLEDMYSIDFSSVEIDDPPMSFKKRGFEFWSNNMILFMKPPTGYDNPHAEAEDYLGFPYFKVKEYMRIDFPRLMSMVHVKISSSEGTVRIKVTKGDGSCEEDSSNTFRTFEDHDHGIELIEISGDFCFLDFFYGEMNYAWITFNVEMKERDPIAAPTGLKAHLLPGKSIVEEGEKPVYIPAAVGLKWNLPPLQILNTDQHVFYEVERQSLGKNDTPQPIDEAQYESVNRENPAFVPRLPIKEDGTREIPEYSSEWPQQTEKEKEEGIMPIFYVDAGDIDEEGMLETPLERDTWYAYRTTGIDIFGRHSIPSEPTTKRAVDNVPPPPPLAVSAKFLDPKDPYLQEEEKEWVTHTYKYEDVALESAEEFIVDEYRKGFRIIWKWPETYYFQAPDAEKFRIYFEPGLFNILEGTVQKILSEKKGLHLPGEITTFEADETIISLVVRTDKEIKIEEEGRFFKYYDNFFEIVKVEPPMFGSTQQRIVFTIDNPLSIAITDGDTGIFDVDYSEVEVYLEKTTVHVQENSFAGKVMRQRGKNFVIMRNTASESATDDLGNPVEKVIFTVQNLTVPPREIPEVNKPASFLVDQDNPLYTDYGNPESWEMAEMSIEVDMEEGKEMEETITYQWGEEKTIKYKLFDIYVSEDSIPEQYRLSLTPQNPTVSGNIGITTVDESGNESTVTSLPVFAVLRDKPEPPSAPDISVLWATIPDYYGISHYDVKWPVTKKIYFYQVYRTMDKTLMLVDAEEHLSGHGDIDESLEEIWEEDGNRKGAIQKNLGDLDTEISDWKNAHDDEKQRKLRELMETYNILRNDTWQYLASLSENEKAFAPVSNPLDPYDSENWEDVDNMVFQDSIEGKGRNNYFYRISAMDKAGNRSSLSIATPPVCVPDVIPPKPPVVTKAVSGDRKAVISWKKNREVGMVRYEIYRTDRKELLADVRMMEKVAEVEADAEGMPLRARVVKTYNGDELVLSGYLDASFVPNAESVNKVYESDENQETNQGTNFFGGFKSLILKVLIDDGNIDVKYMDTEDNEIIKQLKAFGGQAKLEIGNEELPVASVVGVYRGSDTDHSVSILEGISAGEIVLQSEDISSLRDKEMAVDYTDTEGNPQTAERVPYELEYTDEDLQADTYYYCLVAAREGIVGEDAETKKTVELISFPSKVVTAAVYDTSPPEPPEWKRAEWMFPERFPPYVVLEWFVHQPGVKCLVQRKIQGSEIWAAVSQWLSPEKYSEPDKRWSWIFSDKTVRESEDYLYRLKLINASGKTTFSEEISPTAKR
ncbi:MAG: hypothetical protein AYK19_03490 [Theionarchaea archaeon DG-70-1]|nr:MAG: hypothetical protein AYK19_03490 [Theionarchaea archaeon DG-70-1]